MDLKNIEKPILVDDILHHKDNIKILKHLFSFGHFQIDGTPIKNKNYNSKEDFLLNKTFTDIEQHSGFTCQIKNEQEDIPYNEPLSIYCFIIMNQLSKRLDFDYKKITRIIYNYYCRDQFCTEHVDGNTDNEFSIVYNLSTTDGGTIIQGQKYSDKSSQAKIFKSKWLHSSWPIDKDKGRVTLNIKFEI
tara:strand:+ start:46 stop:612 length:567 start_codon:yes stop_codon:yes gene_type:complete